MDAKLQKVLDEMGTYDAIVRRQLGKRLLLDRIEGWTLSPSEREGQINLISRIRTLYSGMRAIATRTAAVEAQIALATGGAAISSWGCMPGIDREKQLETMCDFDAFSVLACQYSQAVQAIRMRVASSAHDRSYVPRALGNVEKYRQKVGAHTADATGNDRDDPSQRFLSTATRLVFTNGRLSMGTEEVQFPGKGGTASFPWAITAIFTTLSERYWPSSSDGDDAISVTDLPPLVPVHISGPSSFSFLRVDTRPGEPSR